jgi:hypothetical protein
MKDSEILFSAGSSFSHWATILGAHKLVFDVSRLSFNRLSSVNIINPDAKYGETMELVRNKLERFMQLQ